MKYILILLITLVSCKHPESETLSLDYNDLKNLSDTIDDPKIKNNIEENQYKVYLVNDNLTSEKGKLEVQLIDFNGKFLWNKISEIQIEANTSQVYFQIEKKEFERFNLNQAVLSLKFNKAKTNYFFTKPKELLLDKPSIQIKKINEQTIEISTDVLAKNVFLSDENEAFFSDNYFDILPNEKRIIKISKPVKEIKVMSLFDTIKQKKP